MKIKTSFEQNVESLLKTRFKGGIAMYGETILLRCYDIISVDSGSILGRFKKKYDAEQVVQWLNGSSGTELIRMQPKDIKFTDLEKFAQLYRAGLCYNSSEEFIIEFKKLLARMNKSYQLKDPNKKAFVKHNNFWWRLSTTTPLDSATLYNYSGGHMSEVNCEGREVVEAEDWSDLDWSGTVLYDNSYKTGWVAPTGEFYGCDYRCHYMCALMVLKKTDKELEEAGYIKVTKDLSKDKFSVQIPYYLKSSYPKPTKKQLETLAGFEIREVNNLLKVYYEELDF